LAAKQITIDVMVLYTGKVASKYLDVDKDVALHSIEEANASFVNSDIGNVKLRLVHSQRIDYDESQGEHFNHLYAWLTEWGPSPRSRPCAMRSAPTLSC
jgi:hypothetical protein